MKKINVNNIQPDTTATIIATGVPLLSALVSAWKQSTAAPAPAPEVEVVDTKTQRPVDVEESLLTEDDADAALEDVSVMQDIMRKLLPEPMPLVTRKAENGDQTIAWDSAVPVMEHGKKFLIWGFCHLWLSGFRLSDDSREWASTLELAAKRAMLDWHGIPHAEAPPEYSDITAD